MSDLLACGLTWDCFYLEHIFEILHFYLLTFWTSFQNSSVDCQVWELPQLVPSLKLSVVARWFHLVQGKEADTPQKMSIVSMDATIILPILKKKLAFLSGKNTDSKQHESYHIWFLWCDLSLLYWFGLQGGRIGAAVSSWPSLWAQIRPAWRSSALLWTTCSAFPGETCSPAHA